jgi:hypothetical protein
MEAFHLQPFLASKRSEGMVGRIVLRTKEFACGAFEQLIVHRACSLRSSC